MLKFEYEFCGKMCRIQMKQNIKYVSLAIFCLLLIYLTIKKTSFFIKYIKKKITH